VVVPPPTEVTVVKPEPDSTELSPFDVELPPAPTVTVIEVPRVIVPVVAVK
jgi:hypothetical protein